jgi:hypothetical protein
MTRRTSDDYHVDAFDSAWRAFAAEDDRATSPPHLERRVIAAARAALDRNARLQRRRLRWTLGVGAAAAAVFAIALGVRLFPPRIEPGPIVEAVPPATLETEEVTEALMTLTADPILETESLQLVRVRVPRAALSALGVTLSEPDSSGVVDVDVLVGDDGLPREIRRIRPVMANGRN